MKRCTTTRPKLQAGTELYGIAKDLLHVGDQGGAVRWLAAFSDWCTRWGDLRQMVKGERNSRVHAMRPTRAEREMHARGVQPDKAYIRQHVRQHVREIDRENIPGNRMRELPRRLESDA